ncbi:MAG: energy-coupling factor transporter transmembrane protein EcfT [Lachnospiraceae bacterium]|nr:energy-coupling factor transporter transmembrane protein EcfT [Lachnospiraceae bacterium]
MLRDITVGQYYPVDSPIHRLDPRVKVVAVFLYLISLFVFSSFTGYAVVTLFLFMAIELSRVPFSYIVKGLKPILFLLAFTAFFNIFWTNGDVLFHWKFITITWQGLRKGAFMAMRLIYLILGSSMLTYTTSPNQLTDAIETLLKPLEKIRVPVHDFAMMMSLALRFIPILMDEANRIINAQSARGADFEEGNLLQRMRAMVSILVPLLVSATRRAYDLALAMESRCYHGGDGRTKMKPLQYDRQDYVVYVLLILYLAAVIVVSHVFVL